MRTLITILLLFTCFTQIFAQNNEIITINNDIQLIHLGDSVFIHKTFDTFDDYGRISSNGLLVIKNGKAIMIDTPMDNAKTQLLTDYISGTLNTTFEMVIVGHYHNDCLGGLDFVHSKNIQSVGNTLTGEKCDELGYTKPRITFDKSFDFDLNGLNVYCYYPGGGHTTDNIVVYIREYNLLFGGCLIKAMGSTNLGNIADADLSNWKQSVHTVINRFPDVETVIPGHGEPGGPELLMNTITLVEEHN